MMTLRNLALRLTQYDEKEGRSIVRLLLEDSFGWGYTDICCGVLEKMDERDSVRLESLIHRLESGEPVQYVTEQAEFYGRRFHVEPGVLIPRPETEGLIELVIESGPYTSPTVLDIGTGSGCIAVTLAKEYEFAHVTAWDISEKALNIAEKNAERLGAEVNFKKQDALNAPDDNGIYDIIVSNPPYICDKEKVAMESNVLNHEPQIALFVPDEEPLLFYLKITKYASKALKEDGILAFEINPLYAEEIGELVKRYNFSAVTIHQDQFGKARYLLARKKIHAA